MKFTTSFVSLGLNVSAYRRVLLNALRNINERAGQAWIDAVVNETPIPTWSGASRATFQKLAGELGTSVPIGPIRAKKDRTALGRESSDGSGVSEDESRPYAGFTYQTSLRYLAYNEYNKAVKGPPPQPYSNNVRFTPYKFQARGLKAWKRVAKTAKLPNPFRYLTKRKM
jgi:hypothetical protein